MARFSVISKGLTLSQLQDEVKRCGGRNLKVASASKQIFCELDVAGMAKLKTVPGLAIKSLGRITTPEQLPAPGVALQDLEALQPVYAASQGSILPGWYELRQAFTPPVIGTGLTTAVLDSGIRSTHRSLRDKVLYSRNYTSSPDVEDHFDHGTGVAFLISGGRHAPGEESGAAPGGKLVNLKVLNDDGVGSEEDVVMALDDIHAITKEQYDRGLPRTEPEAINCINLSLGAPDDGDPDNPMRLACRALIEDFTQHLTAACGNGGPDPETITIPATEPYVWGAGVMTFSPLDIWSPSGRGPTKEGLIKPDLVYPGVNILTAGAASDDAFVTKSGTSFAAPLIAGAGGDLWELLRRVMGEDFVPDRKAFESFFPLLCFKPEGAPAEKDNSYGFGMPLGTAALQVFRPTGAAAMETMISSVTPLIGVGMLGMMMAGMSKAFK